MRIYDAFNIPDELTKISKMDFGRLREMFKAYPEDIVGETRQYKYWMITELDGPDDEGLFLVNYAYGPDQIRSVRFDELFGAMMQHRASNGKGVQMSLGVLDPIKRVNEVEGESIQEKFERFHNENPQVYQKLREIGLWCRRQGKTMGIGAMYEILRWQFGIQTTGSPYKLDNDFRSRYSRLLMQSEPELEGFFRIRELTSE
jgi:hypothetical protein